MFVLANAPSDIVNAFAAVTGGEHSDSRTGHSPAAA
jgi:hypothetical protein